MLKPSRYKKKNVPVMATGTDIPCMISGADVWRKIKIAQEDQRKALEERVQYLADRGVEEVVDVDEVKEFNPFGESGGPRR